MTSEELQAKVSKLEQQTKKNAKAIAKLKKQVAECKYLIQKLSDNSKYQKAAAKFLKFQITHIDDIILELEKIFKA